VVLERKRSKCGYWIYNKKKIIIFGQTLTKLKNAMKNLFMKTIMMVVLLSAMFQFSNAQCVKTYNNESMMGTMFNTYVLTPIKEAVPLADEMTKGVKVYKGIAFNFMKSGSAKYIVLNILLDKDFRIGEKKLSEMDAITLGFEDGLTLEFKPKELVGYFGIDEFTRTAIGAVKVTDELKSKLQKLLVTKINIGDQEFEIKKGKGKKLMKSCCYLG
jgi:hypothetical protein